MLKILLISLLFCQRLALPHPNPSPEGEGTNFNQQHSGVQFTQDTIDTTGSKISPEDARAILDHHNKVRSDLHIPPLSWSADLAAYAQDWADSLATSYNCNLIHRENPGENGMEYGENLYGGSSGETFKPVDASLSWYSEIQQYTYAKIDENNWYNTGHYTQMIWKNTTKIGVGIATCPDGGLIVVANYNPPGNFMGEFPY